MQIRSFLAASAALALTLGATVTQTSGGTNAVIIDMDDVPQAVRDAAKNAVGSIELIEAIRDVSRGRVIYELSGCTAEGTRIEVGVYEDGTLQEVEREIAVKDVPQRMLDVARANVPNFQPSVVMTNERDGPVLSYDMEGEADGSRYGVEVWTNFGNVKVEQWAPDGSSDGEPRCQVGA